MGALERRVIVGRMVCAWGRCVGLCFMPRVAGLGVSGAWIVAEGGEGEEAGRCREDGNVVMLIGTWMRFRKGV